MLPTQKNISQPKISRMIKLRWDIKSDGKKRGGKRRRKREREEKEKEIMN